MTNVAFRLAFFLCSGNWKSALVGLTVRPSAMGVTAPHGRSESGFLLRAPRKPKTRTGTLSGVGTEVGNVRNRVPTPLFCRSLELFQSAKPEPHLIPTYQIGDCRNAGGHPAQPFCTMTVLIACKHSRHPPNNENVEFRRFLHACIWVETRISGIESSQQVPMGEPPTPTHPIYCALGSRAYSNLNLISTHMEPDICTVAALPPLIPIPPPHSCTATCRHSPRRTITTHHLHPSCLSSHYSLKPSLGR